MKKLVLNRCGDLLILLGFCSSLCNPVNSIHRSSSMRNAFVLVTILSLATLLLPAQPRTAQQPTRNSTQASLSDAPSREQLLKLFEMLEIRKQMDSMRDTLAKTLEQQFSQMSHGQLSAKQKHAFAQLETELFGKLMSDDFV